MMKNDRSIDMPSIQQMVVAVVASILLINTVTFSQYASASIETADTDIAEAAEAGNATMMTADEIADGNTTAIEFMAIQRSESGSLSQVNDTAYTLELSNVSDSTILFSDRPSRIVTSISTSDFVVNWTAGPDSFAADAPNTALIVEAIQTGDLDTAIIELFNPMYDMNTNTLTYTIMAENATSIAWPGEFGQSVLVIDSPPCNPSPNGANGLNDCGY